MEKGTFGIRIREQRERLGYSQAYIAEQLGITARSQRNYETGTRVPNAEYLAAIAPLGVDINYVLNGEKAYVSTTDASDSHVFLTAIEMAFGISATALEAVIDKSLGEGISDGYDPAVFFDGMLQESPVFRLMADKYSEFNTSLLGSIIFGVEESVTKNSLKITAQQKADAIVVLYRIFRASHNRQIDQATIADIVKLAGVPKVDV